MGQYSKKNAGKTTCPNCPEKEDLNHVFNICPKYKGPRKKLIQELKQIKSPATYPEFLQINNQNHKHSLEIILNYLRDIDKTVDI
ncbi:hypothetical protein ACJMK2_034875 [Sinanodonta woodiana]|uniref:Reverse transcriptase zinc-binding domain-containing protein n=1 Tax=Sinanodonta woodiana TaxID=1069815 RepID=A0ABD3WTJ8_SINWO